MPIEPSEAVEKFLSGMEADQRRAWIRSLWFGYGVTETTITKDEVMTKELSGRRGDILIIDDPIAISDAARQRAVESFRRAVAGIGDVSVVLARCGETYREAAEAMAPFQAAIEPKGNRHQRRKELARLRK